MYVFWGSFLIPQSQFPGAAVLPLSSAKLHRNANLKFVIPIEAEGSAVDKRDKRRDKRGGQKGDSLRSVSERKSGSPTKRLGARGEIAPARTREYRPESSYGDWSKESANRATAALHMVEGIIWMRT